MRVATRYCVAVAALGLAATAWIWSAWLAPERTDPCKHPDLLSVTGLIPRTPPTGQRGERLSDDVIQWSEGTLDGGDRLRFQIVRSYDVLKVAERPLSLLSEAVEPETVSFDWVDAADGRLPVHTVRTTGTGAFMVVSYLYVLGNDPVREPVVAQLERAFRALQTGPAPLTIFLAFAPATGETESEARRLAVSWVRDAWSHYRIACLPSRSKSFQ